jgi:hypothetical protein
VGYYCEFAPPQSSASSTTAGRAAAHRPAWLSCGLRTSVHGRAALARIVQSCLRPSFGGKPEAFAQFLRHLAF